MRLAFSLLTLWLVGVSSSTAQSGLADTTVVVSGQVAQRLDSLLSDFASQGYGGGALLVHNRAPVLRKGYGLANRGTRAPFTPSTVVQIGSNTKDLTAVAILQLMERGQLRLEDSLPRFFGTVPADKRAITVLELLRHQAGLPDGVGPDFEVLDRDAFLRRAFAVRLLSRPGEKREYSNMGYSLLAAIIETVTKQSYDDFVRENILSPLGLHDTGYLSPAFDARRVAHGYSDGRDRGTMLDRPHARDGHYWNLRGNGGTLSTLPDMARFYDALFNGQRLLKAASRDRMFPPDRPMALAGGDGVHQFLYLRFPAEQLDLFVTSNAAGYRIPEGRIAAILRPRMATAPGNDGAGEAALPETALGRVTREYLDAFNGGSADSRLRFFSERFLPDSSAAPPDVRVTRMRNAREELGRLIVTAFVELSSTRAEISVKTASGGTGMIAIEMEAGAPYRIRSLSLRVTD